MDFLSRQNTKYHYDLRPIDFNNDGLDDLMTIYKYCLEECQTNHRVLLNSDDGFDENNYIQFDSSVEIQYYDKQADINGDGYIDFITRNSDYNETGIVKLYMNSGTNLEAVEVNIPGIVFDRSNIIDFNNDGKDDLFFTDSDSKLNVIFGYEDLNNLQIQQINDFETNTFDFFDYDNDGDLDIYSIENNRTELFIREYENGDYQNTIHQQDLDTTSYYMIVDDLDNDNIAEIIMSNGVYQADNAGNYNKIYSFNSSGKILISDVDGDLLKYIIYGANIYLAREFLFQTGLNYEPNHSGHGFSVENVGEDLFFTVFYSYDNSNYPTWYSDLGFFEKPHEDYWRISEEQLDIIKFKYDYDTNSTIPQSGANDIRYIAHNKCSDTYGDINLSYGFGEAYVQGIPTGNIIESGNWCSKPLVDYYKRPENNMSGLWWAGNEDSGWGWSIELIEHENNATDIVILLYYYDAAGNPRWLIGSQSGFEAGVPISIPMNMVKGYPRSNTTSNIELFEAGTIDITLNQASSNLLNSGSMSIDVIYPGEEGGNWVRNNIPIALFSTPK